MAKDWFPHDYHAHSDSKCLRLLSKGQANAYGCYWLIVELLHSEPELTLTDVIDVLEGYTKDADMVVELLISCGLFYLDDHKLISDRVTDNLNKRNDITEKRRESGQKGGQASAKQTQRMF